MHKYRALFFPIFLFGIVAGEESDQNPSIVVWYPIPIKLTALQHKLSDTKSSELFSHSLVTYLNKLVYLQRTDAEKQVDVESKNDSNKENPEKCNNETSKHVKTANNFFNIHNTSYEVTEFPNGDAEIGGELSKYNLAGGNKDAAVTHLGLLDKNEFLIMSASDAATQEGDPLNSPSVGDLLSDKNAKSEKSDIKGSNPEANENGNDTKVITVKIIGLDEASGSALDQPDGDSLQSSEDSVATRLFNIISTPSVDAVTETIIDGPALDEEIKLLQNTKVQSNDTLKERVLEENYEHNNAENPMPSLNQTNKKSKVKNKINLRYTLTDPNEYDEETLNSLVEELLGYEYEDDSSITEINTESVYERNFFETNSPEDSTKIDSNNDELTIDGRNKNENKLKANSNKTNEKEYYEINEETEEIVETHEEKTQVSETKAEETDAATEKNEEETKVSTETNEQQTTPTIAERSGILDKKNNKEEVPVHKNVSNINLTDYSESNGSFRVLYSSDSKKNIDTGNDDKASVLIKRYLLDLNKTESGSSRLTKTEVDQLTSTQDDTTCKCMHRVLKLLLHDLIKKTGKFQETSAEATASSPEGSKSTEQSER